MTYIKNHLSDLAAYTPIKEDAHGWSTWQLWVLMQTFGPHIYMSATPCFLGDIEVVE